MRKGYFIADQNGLYFLTFTVVGWIDVFSRKELRDVLIRSMDYCIRYKGLQVYAYVIMTNHLHVIWSATEGSGGLSSIVRDFKKHTAKEILKFISGYKESRSEWMNIIFRYHARYKSTHKKYKVWRNSNRPIEILRPAFARQKLDYIHRNPVTAGIVEKEEHYLYSSARQYKNIYPVELEVRLLDFGAEEGFVRL